jgi:Leucine-rich repeat (LRR) protein
MSFEECKEMDWLPFNWKSAVQKEVQFRIAPDFNPDDVGLQFGTDAEMRKHWLDSLPKQKYLRYLKIVGGNQTLFETCSQLPLLERLDIEFFKLQDLSAVSQLRNLTHFHLNGSPKIDSFKDLASCKGLKALGIFGKFPLVASLDFIAQLSRLESINLVGQDYHTQKFDSLEPLSEITGLRSVSLAGVRPQKFGLAPLAKLEKLEYLGLDPYRLKEWSIKDYRRIYENCTNLKGDLVRLLATDPAFQKKHKIK